VNQRIDHQLTKRNHRVCVLDMAHRIEHLNLRKPINQMRHYGFQPPQVTLVEFALSHTPKTGVVRVLNDAQRFAANTLGNASDRDRLPSPYQPSPHRAATSAQSRWL
jgi:hypothetical protein